MLEVDLMMIKKVPPANVAKCSLSSRAIWVFYNILRQKYQKQSIVGRNLGNAGLNGLHFIGRASVFLGSKQSYFLPLFFMHENDFDF